MKYLLSVLLLSLVFSSNSFASGSKDSAYLDALNRFIDHAVVNKDKAALDTLYSEDFMFTHGTGLIDSKSSWIKGVTSEKAHYLSREHDSTIVEVHEHIAMIYGKLTIVRTDGTTKNKYAIKYVRVFLFNQGRWQMISHRTVEQWNNLPV
jgi:ketosteroid isomerase-like protein